MKFTDERNHPRTLKLKLKAANKREQGEADKRWRRVQRKLESENVTDDRRKGLGSR